MSRSVQKLCVVASLFVAAFLPSLPDVAIGQNLTTISNFGTHPNSSLFDRPSSKVLNILPISNFSIHQDVAATQDVESLPGGEVLPGLENSQELVIPQDNEPETLPDSREANANPAAKYSVTWVGLNNRAKPKTEAAGQGNGHVGRDRAPSSSLSRTFRRPSPPPPVINPFQPAFVHVPVPIQVVPMYVDHYHYWPGVPGVPSDYFGLPSVVPTLPPVPGPYSGSYFTPPPAPTPMTFGIDRRFHVPTDQPMRYIPEVNLVGNVSNSINFVSYPLNHHSYPAYRAYGVQVQTFPVHRRLP